MSLTYFVDDNEGKGPSPCTRFPFTHSPLLPADTAWFQLVIDSKLSKWTSLQSHSLTSVSQHLFADCCQNCSFPKKKETSINFTEGRHKNWSRSRTLFTYPRSANCLCLEQWLNSSGKFGTKLYPQSRMFRFSTERLWLYDIVLFCRLISMEYFLLLVLFSSLP